MATLFSFFASPVRNGPAAPPASEAQASSSSAATPWRRDEEQPQNTLGRLFSPAVNERNGASPSAVAAARYAPDDADNVDGPSPSPEPVENFSMFPAAEEPSPPPAETRLSARNSDVQLTSMTVAGEEGDGNEEFAFKRFLDHRQTGQGNNIEIKVEWERGPPTWEPEINLHRDAPEFLFKYWKSTKGGRPRHPQDSELYDIFKIRKHSKDKKQLQIEWLGYDKSEWTWMDRAEVEETAKGLVDAYWKGLKNKKKQKK